MALNAMQLERYYNAPIGQVYSAIKHYLASDQSRFTLKNTDDLSCSCTFSSGISMTTWGENLTASAIPSGDGTLVRLTVAGKVGSTAAGLQNSHNVTIADEFFTGVSGTLSTESTEPAQVKQDQKDSATNTLIQESKETQPETEANPDPVTSTDDVPEAKATTFFSSDTAPDDTQETAQSNVRAIWNKYRLQIVIASITVVAITLISVIAIGISNNNQSKERLEIVQKVATACNRNNKIKVLSDGDYSNEPALQMVWSSIPDREILECIAANTGMSESTIDTIGYSHSSEDNSSSQWKDWKAAWMLDDETMYATITIQYFGTNPSVFKTKATLKDITNKEEESTNTTEEASEPQPFTIGMNCYVTSGDGDLSTHTEHLDGVTSQNFRDTVWKTGKSVRCSAEDDDSKATGVKSATDYEALRTAYGDRADDTEYGMGALYGECASTSFIELSLQPMSEDQAQGLLGALVLCPDHPRAEEIRQRAQNDMARLNDIASKRQQGLIKDDGTYKIPSEMTSGTWRTMSDKVTNCYWEMQDTNGQIYDNNFVSAGIAQTITIPNGVAGFSSQGCGAWEKQ